MHFQEKTLSYIRVNTVIMLLAQAVFYLLVTFILWCYCNLQHLLLPSLLLLQRSVGPSRLVAEGRKRRKTPRRRMRWMMISCSHHWVRMTSPSRPWRRAGSHECLLPTVCAVSFISVRMQTRPTLTWPLRASPRLTTLKVNIRDPSCAVVRSK